MEKLYQMAIVAILLMEVLDSAPRYGLLGLGERNSSRAKLCHEAAEHKFLNKSSFPDDI